jgi:hypothetical protein
MWILALHALAGPFEAVRNILGRKIMGPSVNIDGWLWMVQWVHSKQSETFSERNYWVYSGTSIPPFPDPAGRFKAFGNTFKRKLLGSSVTVDAGIARFNGPIQSSRKHYRTETTGPIREHRYHLSMLRWAHSKQSETIFTGPFRERQYWLCMLWRAHSKQSETFSGGDR